MQRKKLTIGLFGFGCVGQGLYEVLEKTPSLNAEIKTICIKHPEKTRSISFPNFTTDAAKILNDPEINIVIELIDDAEAAYHIVSQALRKKKAVISANKKMIATHLEELITLQEQNGVPLLYEAACCASIPVIRNLEEYYDHDLLQSIEGIVNGSTNFILSTTANENCSYEYALNRAQELGYAESDPSLDTQGFDAKYKLVLLLAHAFGLLTKPETIFNIGIDRLQQTALDYAKEKKIKIKLLAYAARNEEEKIEAFVLPRFVAATDKLFAVEDVFNGLKINSVWTDTQFFSGKGAGAVPTATAIISDLSALGYGYKYEYKKLNLQQSMETPNNLELRIFLSSQQALSLEVQAAFETIEEWFVRANSGYCIGTIRLNELQLLLEKDKNLCPVLFSVVRKNHTPKALEETVSLHYL